MFVLVFDKNYVIGLLWYKTLIFKVSNVYNFFTQVLLLLTFIIYINMKVKTSIDKKKRNMKKEKLKLDNFHYFLPDVEIVWMDI